MYKQKKLIVAIVLAICSVASIFSADSSIDFAEELQSFLEKGDLTGAIQLFDQMPESLKTDKDLMLVKASLFMSDERYSESQSVVRQILSEDPKNIDALELNVYIAKGLKNKAKKTEAINALLAEDSENPVANIELARDQFEKKNYSSAARCYKTVLSKYPEDTNSLLGLGQAYYYAKEDQKASDTLKKVLALDENNAQANLFLGKLCMARDAYPKALEYAKKAVTLDPKSADAWLDYGMDLRMDGKYSKAIECWTKAIELNPNFFLGYAYRAGLNDELGNFQEALQDYRKVVEVNPKYFYAYESIGMMEWHEQNWTLAREAFEKAYSFNKDGISYPLLIAACYIREGNEFQVKAFLDKVMKPMSDKKSNEYKITRLYKERNSINAENDLALNIPKETNSTKRGKLLYYFGLYYELLGKNAFASEYYSQIVEMKAPMFFEYRMAEWGMNK